MLRLSDFSIGMAEGSCCWYHTCLGWCLLLQAPFLLPTWCSRCWGSSLASASQASSSFQQSSVIISFHHLNIHCIRSYIIFTSEATEEKIYEYVLFQCHVDCCEHTEALMSMGHNLFLYFDSFIGIFKIIYHAWHKCNHPQKNLKSICFSRAEELCTHWLHVTGHDGRQCLVSSPVNFWLAVRVAQYAQ